MDPSPGPRLRLQVLDADWFEQRQQSTEHGGAQQLAYDADLFGWLFAQTRSES